MSDTVLSNRWVVYYSAENRQKRIVRDTSVTPTTIDSVNALYSALQDHFDELAQMDDGVPMSAQTPTEYTIGIIDAGDKDPWFIDRQSVEYLKGGAIKTASWNRVQDSNTGIVRITCDNTSIVAGDIGYDITHADLDSGTLLDVKGTGAGSTLWVRPDSFAAANNFDSTTGTLTCNTHTATQSAAASAGESLWANVYSLGTIEAKTHLFIYQNNANLVAYKGTSDWWGDEHIDILVNVKEVGTEIDLGYITVIARQYSKTYDYYIVDLSAGGRNPIPLATGDDLNNETGYRKFTGSAGTGTFVVGEEIYKSGTNKRGILTAVAGTGAAPELTYYLIGDPITDFILNDTSVTGATSGATCTAGTPANYGPAALVGLSIVHASNETFDVDENGTTENYSIRIDVSLETLADAFEWCKYITRRGDTGTGNTDGIAGEQYIGSDYRIIYTSITGSIAEGSVVTQYSGGYGSGYVATGTVVAHNLTDKILILRNSRDAFNSTNPIYVDATNYVSGPTSTPLAPIKVCSYGSFAGGVFFCAPGVVLQNVPSADANNYQLVDDNGNVVKAPTKVTVKVGNTRALDRVAVFRLTAAGGEIKKDEYSCTAQALGANTLIVGESITADTVGRSAGGIVRLVDTSASQEYRIRFSSWSGSTFTLASTEDDVMEAGTDTDTIVATGAFTNSKVGDIIYNITRTTVTYIKSITSANEVEVAPAVTGQVATDTFDINTLPVATTVSDDAYVPFVDAHEITGTDGAPGEEEGIITFTSNIPCRIRARQAGDIIPFEADSTITSAGMTMNVIRTPDTIYT
ncbi:hypothetical protein COV28_01485 [candidate division WWE3 bacterium CG10_big_fil_rev_8_21_14_0_10_48_23]|nr:MAG: hypothetical protein COV28_01485 [candidate division WWE3 bacterium CG10_big_fil_rev_8_21_14_0_10_48_23]